MWSSIKQIIKPESLDEALILESQPGSAFFSGGSYLLAQKQKHIHTLLDINHLLNNNIESLDHEMILGASCTLQELIGSGGTTLDKAIISSCPSKNIRNQRTIGGEIVMARPDSELMAYLYAAEARLGLHGIQSPIRIMDWDGKGILTNIIIPVSNITLERVSVLDSAPAFVIVAVSHQTDIFHICIGGKAKKMLYLQTSNTPLESAIRKFMDEVLSIYTLDHFGSPEFKQQLVSNLLYAMTVAA